MNLFDMHCHLDFLADGASADVSRASMSAPGVSADTTCAASMLAREGAARGIHAFSNTVTPAGYARASRLLGACGNVRVGVGMHPWWVADGSIGEAEVGLFEECAKDAPFVGEVGLDFAPRREGTRDAQVAAFACALDVCAQGGKVISIHAVRSASTVLDMLEERGACAKNACILHWFSGSSDELTRAVRLGCYFSINPRMASTKRGRAYVRVIPADRLLLETDMPASEGAPYAAGDWERDLRGVLAAVAQARREDACELAEIIARTSAALLAVGR